MCVRPSRSVVVYVIHHGLHLILFFAPVLLQNGRRKGRLCIVGSKMPTARTCPTLCPRQGVRYGRVRHSCTHQQLSTVVLATLFWGCFT